MKNSLVIYIALLYLIFGSSITGHTQRQDYNWIFGYQTTNLTGQAGSILNFQGGNRDTIFQLLPWAMGANNTSISSKENGKLLFYSNGCAVFDSSHQIMMNGDSLNLGEIYDNNCGGGYGNTGIANTLILPDPSNEKGYYLIHKTEVLISEPFLDIISPDIKYTYVDMTLNDGLGAVTEKNEVFFDEANSMGGFLTACKHENGNDWWVLQPEKLGNRYFKFLLNESGITLHDTQILGPTFDYFSEGAQAKFTPDGTKYLLFNAINGLLVFDFDRTTSTLSNLNVVNVLEEYRPTGLSTSPNSRFAYLSAGGELFQVDLWADDLQESLTLIAEWDGFVDPLPTNFHLGQLGPDCRIYIGSTNGSKYLHVIHQPNEKGMTCDVRQHDLEVPNYIWSGSMPNFPHFRMDEDDICDPTITSVFGIPFISTKSLKIFPNPTSELLSIENRGFKSIEIMDYQGRILVEKKITLEELIEINTSGLVDGIYLARGLNDEGEVWMGRFVVSH